MIPQDQSSHIVEPVVLVPTYSSFWPLAILLAALLGWFGYQDYLSYSQGSDIRAELTKAQPALSNAATAYKRFRSLIDDLQQTAAHDQYAAQIAKEANIPLTPSSAPATDPNAGH